MQRYILALDQGTTSSRAILFGRDGSVGGHAQQPFQQYYPQPGWVEHDPNEIWESERAVAAQALRESGLGRAVAAIGITNQRETTILWDRATGEPIHNAIVWQCRRTADIADALREKRGVSELVAEKMGLHIDAYFSATKIKWLLDHVPGARERAERGEILFGTVETWLIWRLTGGKVHVTDYSNASRTMLFNIHDLKWDEELLKLLDIPASMMPEVKSSSEVYGHTKTTIFAHEVPIAGIAGDQQAALFGQMCLEPGAIKNTYGTGCFVMLNTGDKPVMSKNNLLTTVAWKIGDQVNYALEGSIYVGGSVVQWLRDGLGIIQKSSDVETLASTVPDSGGVRFVPALTGLAAPYWDAYARGTITGITRGTTAAHIARAALDGIAFQTYDIAQAMSRDLNAPLTELKVDGGASRNNLLMQYQANLLGINVIRPKITETTALGAAYLAGLAVGFWKDIDEVKKQWQVERTFEPAGETTEIEEAKKGWKDAIQRTLSRK